MTLSTIHHADGDIGIIINYNIRKTNKQQKYDTKTKSVH